MRSVSMMRKILCLLLAAASTVPAFARENSAIKYRTVAAAMADLKAKKDATISVQNGWTVIEDQAGAAIWSFVPVGHPAYPAVIRRAIVVQDGKSGIATESLCQASKSACDKLMDEYEKAGSHASADARTSAIGAHGTPARDIQVQRLGDDAFRLVLTSYTSKTAEAGQRELLSKAQQLCGTKPANFGRYEFNLIESFRVGGSDKGHLELKQTISCGEAAATPTPSQAIMHVAASAEQIRQVEQQARLYFAAKDQRRYQQAYALMAPVQKLAVPFDAWQARVDAFNDKAGAVRERAIRKITWYQDPPQAAPGLYAAVDFVSQFANLEVHCGFVAWQQQPDGSFLLVREEENSLDKVTAKNLKPEEIERVRVQFKCKD